MHLLGLIFGSQNHLQKVCSQFRRFSSPDIYIDTWTPQSKARAQVSRNSLPDCSWARLLRNCRSSPPSSASRAVSTLWSTTAPRVLSSSPTSTRGSPASCSPMPASTAASERGSAAAEYLASSNWHLCRTSRCRRSRSR